MDVHTAGLPLKRLHRAGLDLFTGFLLILAALSLFHYLREHERCYRAGGTYDPRAALCLQTPQRSHER